MPNPPRSRLADDMTLTWRCRDGDVVLWLTYPSIFARVPELVDYWQVRGAEELLLTNRWEDIPDYIPLHPTEVRGRYIPRMRELIARGEHPDEVLEAPNLWRAKAGDRLVWTGPSLPDRPAVDGIVALLDVVADALIIGPPRIVMEAWGRQPAPSDGLSQEEADRCNTGIRAAAALGLPRVLSASPWALG